MLSKFEYLTMSVALCWLLLVSVGIGDCIVHFEHCAVLAVPSSACLSARSSTKCNVNSGLRHCLNLTIAQQSLDFYVTEIAYFCANGTFSLNKIFNKSFILNLLEIVFFFLSTILIIIMTC